MIKEIYPRYAWAVDLIVVLIVMSIWVMILRAIGSGPIHAIRVLWTEMKELTRRKWTVGALNALAMILMFVIGITLVVADATAGLSMMIAKWLDVQSTVEYGTSANLTVVIVLLGAVLILSLVAAVADGRKE